MTTGNDYEFLSDKFNKTMNEAEKKGYNLNYAHVQQKEESESTLDKITSGLATIGAIGALAFTAYGVYKFYTKIYRPLKKSMEKPFVNEESDQERILNGSIIHNSNPRRGSIIRTAEWIKSNGGMIEDAEFTIQDKKQ